MSDLDIEMQRLVELDTAVRYYLAHLAAFEHGSQHDASPLAYWREQIELLTSGEVVEVDA